MNTSRISKTTGAIMIAAAVSIDILQILLDIMLIGILLDTIIGAFAGMIFGVWFSHLGVSITGPKKILGFLGTMVGELTPLIDGIPFWTAFITYTVMKEWRRQEEI